MRVLRNQGHLLLGFPAGSGEVLFNAQRLLSLEEIISEVPGTVITLIRTVGDGSTEEIAQNFKDPACVGILLQISK